MRYTVIDLEIENYIIYYCQILYNIEDKGF